MVSQWRAASRSWSLTAGTQKSWRISGAGCSASLSSRRKWTAVLRSARPGNDPENPGLTLVFSPSSEPKQAKLRLHFDVNAVDRGQDEELRRLFELGARRADVGADRPGILARTRGPRGQRILPAAQNGETSLLTLGSASAPPGRGAGHGGLDEVFLGHRVVAEPGLDGPGESVGDEPAGPTCSGCSLTSRSPPPLRRWAPLWPASSPTPTTAGPRPPPHGCCVQAPPFALRDDVLAASLKDWDRDRGLYRPLARTCGAVAAACLGVAVARPAPLILCLAGVLLGIPWVRVVAHRLASESDPES